MSSDIQIGLTDLTDVAKLYTDSFIEHGATAKGVGWTDKIKHELRLDILSRAVSEESSSFTVNDLGCGYGALFEWFEKNNHKIEYFNGYDISEEMLNAAKERLPKDRVSFFNLPAIQTKSDYSFASGIFNVPMGTNEDEWKTYVQTILDNMFEYSKKGFAFNMLTSYVDWRADNLFYGNPTEYFDLCKTRYSKYVSLHHDYPLWEFTIVVRKKIQSKGQK